MTHVAFQPPGPTIELQTDYAVVGSGAGGATAAVTLARAGARVVVVEAGAWRDPDDYPGSIYGAMRDMLDSWGSNFTRGRAFWPILQGTVVGGSTVINSAICVRTPADVFERWQREHGVGGEALANAVWSAQEELERELHAEVVPARALGRSNLLAKRGADALGFDSHYLRRYVKACHGDGQCLQGCKADRKQSLNRNFMPEVLARGGDVLSCAPVARVLFNGERACGVRGRFRHPQSRRRGAEFVVRASKGVIVAASATRSPLLLRRSGLRTRMLGKGFRAHPGAAIYGCYDAPVDMNTGATQGWGSLAYREQPGFKLETLALPLDMMAGRLAGAGALLMERLTEFRHIAMWVQACRAESVGEVRAALGGKPAVYYTLSESDMRRFREGMYTLAKMHVAAGARAVLPAIHGMPYKLEPDQIDRLRDAPLDPRAYISIVSHLFGGCVMGQNPEQSVCDGDGRVHGRRGLWVVDASAIPTNLGVNPQHTIMALARVWSQRLLAAA
jgi:choline dehydrogenase-like flavoprotein